MNVDLLLGEVHFLRHLCLLLGLLRAHELALDASNMDTLQFSLLELAVLVLAVLRLLSSLRRHLLLLLLDHQGSQLVLNGFRLCKLGQLDELDDPIYMRFNFD